MDFDRQGQGSGLSRIKAGGGADNGGNGRGRLLTQPRREGKTLKARRDGSKTKKLGGDFGRNNHITKQETEQFNLPDPSEVEQDGGVGDDDHFGKMALSETSSTASIDSVTSTSPRSPSAF